VLSVSGFCNKLNGMCYEIPQKNPNPFPSFSETKFFHI
jgi:hypothetical protein